MCRISCPISPFGEAVCVYVNSAGRSACPANRAIWGTQEMTEEGRESPLTGQTVVAGEPADVLYGDIVIVGYDPLRGSGMLAFRYRVQGCHRFVRAY